VCMRMCLHSGRTEEHICGMSAWRERGGGREGGREGERERLGECVAGSMKELMRGTCGDSVGLDSCTPLVQLCYSPAAPAAAGTVVAAQRCWLAAKRSLIRKQGKETRIHRRISGDCALEDSRARARRGRRWTWQGHLYNTPLTTALYHMGVFA
jgi:hypothetical protein